MHQSDDILFSTLLQLIVIILAARGANQLLRRFGQPGAVGEIIAGLMLGYLNKPEATATAFRDLWFHTGDLAQKDADGYYFYQGRNKDVIRRRGQNISAWEVELESS